MSTEVIHEKIPEKMYKELKKPVCPKCEDPLTHDDPGSWYCENPDCKYEEYNNITKCDGEECDELVLSKTINFDNVEDRYCQYEHPETPTCLAIAQAEHYEIMRHKDTCSNEDCDCRNY